MRLVRYPHRRACIIASNPDDPKHNLVGNKGAMYGENGLLQLFHGNVLVHICFHSLENQLGEVLAELIKERIFLGLLNDFRQRHSTQIEDFIS